MIQVKIWHADNTRDSFFYRENGNIYNMAQAKKAYDTWLYEMVSDMHFTEAKNHVEALDQAYAFSQNLDRPWRAGKPCRSTSVGDILEVENTLYIVAPMGFDEIKEI